MIERFQIPGVGAIIEKVVEGQKCILVQNRIKPNNPGENGLLEIPAGKIREFENLFSTLRREVREETGLTITSIEAEAHSNIQHADHYQVLSCEPFCVSQNTSGSYPILVITFLCKASGKLLKESDESQNIRWMPVTKVAQLLDDDTSQFYPMHIYALKKYLQLM